MKVAQTFQFIYPKISTYQMKNYLFYDEETGEHFFVQDESLWKANETAHKYFKRPFFIDEMDDAEAEDVRIRYLLK